MRFAFACAFTLGVALSAKHEQAATTQDVMFAATMILLALSGMRRG